MSIFAEIDASMRESISMLDERTSSYCSNLIVVRGAFGYELQFLNTWDEVMATVRIDLNPNFEDYISFSLEDVQERALYSVGLLSVLIQDLKREFVNHGTLHRAEEYR